MRLKMLEVPLQRKQQRRKKQINRKGFIRAAQMLWYGRGDHNFLQVPTSAYESLPMAPHLMILPFLTKNKSL